MTQAGKTLLYKMLAEIEDLRANQVVLNQLSGFRVSPADAQDAMMQAKQNSRKRYDALRVEIEELA